MINRVEKPVHLSPTNVPLPLRSTMRRTILLFLILNFVVIGFLVHSVFTLLTLLVETGDTDAITRGEIPSPGSPLNDDRPQLIPRILHQTYINETIPEKWKEPVQQCLDLHGDYEYKVCCRCKSGPASPMTDPIPIALDRCFSERVYRKRVPVVPGDLRQLSLPYPTSRYYTVLCSGPLWWHIP